MSLKFAFSVLVTLDQPLEVGPVPAGTRKVIPITGGTFEGPNLKGKVIPGGADYQIVRPDGVAEVEAHYTMQTDDGAYIYVVNRGYRHGSKEVLERLAKGEDVSPDSYYFRTTPVLEVSGDKYAFLNRTIYVGYGARHSSHVEIKFYEVL